MVSSRSIFSAMASCSLLSTTPRRSRRRAVGAASSSLANRSSISLCCALRTAMAFMRTPSAAAVPVLALACLLLVQCNPGRLRRHASPGGSVATGAAATGAPTPEEATAFVADVEANLRKLWVARDQAAWVNQNFITDDTEALSSAGEEATAAYVAEAI